MRRAVSVLGAGLALASAAAGCGSSGGGDTLRVSGSTTVNPVAADAATALRATGMKITVDSQGGSAGGIAQLGQGQIDIAMSSKPIAPADRRAYPKVNFVSTRIGEDAVGIVVRREVVDGGLRSIGKAQLGRLFEGKIANWRELGGPNLPVFVYDKEPGRGTREVLDKYLYGPTGKGPPPPQSGSYAIVGGNEETRTKLLSTPGSVGPLSSAFIRGYPTLATLAVGGVQPTARTIADGTYPMSRPLFLVTNGPARGKAKRFIDYVVSPAGQRLVAKAGYLTLAEVRAR